MAASLMIYCVADTSDPFDIELICDASAVSRAFAKAFRRRRLFAALVLIYGRFRTSALWTETDRVHAAQCRDYIVETLSNDSPDPSATHEWLDRSMRLLDELAAANRYEHMLRTTPFQQAANRLFPSAGLYALLGGPDEVGVAGADPEDAVRWQAMSVDERLEWARKAIELYAPAAMREDPAFREPSGVTSPEEATMMRSYMLGAWITHRNIQRLIASLHVESRALTVQILQRPMPTS